MRQRFQAVSALDPKTRGAWEHVQQRDRLQRHHRLVEHCTRGKHFVREVMPEALSSDA